MLCSISCQQYYHENSGPNSSASLCSTFQIERAVIIVDERGKSMGEGIIEFARKPGAQMALRRCTEGCFFLTAYVICLGPYTTDKYVKFLCV